ncbi:MAG: hypothetical protein R8M38_03680 [Mariprofundaceae bacterium]
MIWLLSLVLAGMLSSCAVHDIPETTTVQFDAEKRWAMLPVLNYSGEPRAGERAEAMLATLLQTRNVNNLTFYPSVLGEDGLPELNERTRLKKSILWAKSQAFHFAFSGVINEWRYKSGLDAEPAVGFSLQVIDIRSGQIIWSTSGSRSGWGRESLSGNAQKVLRELVHSIPFQGEG